MEEMSLPLYAAASQSDHEDDTRNAENSETTRILRPSSSLQRDGSSDSLISQSVAASLSGSQNVRLNVAQTVATAPSENEQRLTIAAYVRTVLQLPQAIAAAIVVPIALEKGESCVQPLALWASIYGISLLTSLACAWMLHLYPNVRQSEMTWPRRWADKLMKPMENFLVVWILVGQIWLQDADTCAETSPILVSLTFWLVVVGFCYLLLPCIIIILMMPFLCFCLPCVIRVLARVTGNPMQGKGASKQDIDALPSRKYFEGIFSADEDPQCSICLSQYELEQEIRILPCNGRHHFHKDCCDEWLLVNATCPICRARVIGGDDDEDEDSNSGVTNVV